MTPGRGRTLLGFAAFGAFWGTWGAALPAVRAHAGVSDGELGVALLCIGAGALVSMRPAGGIVDRLGRGVLPVTAAALAASALLPAVATSAVGLGAALLVVGAASGAYDVAVNAEGVRAEAAGRPLLNLGHAAFSGAVVVFSLLTGVLRGAGAEGPLVLGIVAGVLALVAAALFALPAAPAVPRSPEAAGLGLPRRLLVIGALTALAYFIENAWQSWSALQLEDTLDAAAPVAALGPALFASAAVVGRLGGQRMAGRVGDSVLVAAGATIAAAGSLVAALAPSPPLALLGIALAGLGTSVCAPTLISLAGRGTEPQLRGSAVSLVTTIAYLGFLVGPAAVGLVAGAASLRAALAGVAGLALLLAVAVRSVQLRP